MNEMREYETWKSGFSMADDGVSAFHALKAMEVVKFEFATKTEGWIERVEKAI